MFRRFADSPIRRFGSFSANSAIQQWLHLAALILFVTVAYYPSLDAPFNFDDFPNIVANPSVHPEKAADLINVLRSPVSAERPLVLLTFGINYLIGYLDVFNYHVVNILIHIANAILLYLIIVHLPIVRPSSPSPCPSPTGGEGTQEAKLGVVSPKGSGAGEEEFVNDGSGGATFPLPSAGEGQGEGGVDLHTKQALAFWASTLWAMNPVQTQAVTYIVQRMTSMATFFYLTAIYIFIRWRQKKISGLVFSPFRFFADSPIRRFADSFLALALIVACFLLGMASKEIAITLPVALLLLDYLFFAKKITKPLVVTGILILLALVSVGPLYLSNGLPDWFTRYSNRNFSPWERVMTQWRILWHYLSLFLLPVPGRLHLAYDPEVSRGLLQPATTLVGLAAIICTCWLAWRQRLAWPACALAIFFFFLTQAVEASFLNLELAFIHRLYLPSVFLVVGLLSLLPAAFFRRAGVLLVLVLALWSYWTVERNGEWVRGDTFWASDLDRGASPARALANKAAALMDGANYQESLPLLEEGLTSATKEERKIILYNLGICHFFLKHYEESQRYLKELADIYGAYRDTFLYFGQSLLLQDKKNKAQAVADELLALPELRYQGKVLAADILSASGRPQEAENLINQALLEESPALMDRRLKLLLELAALYLRHGKLPEAHKTYLEIVTIFPQNYFAWKQLYYMLVAGGDTKGAETIRNFLAAKGVGL